jgi:hypothetical protein
LRVAEVHGSGPLLAGTSLYISQGQQEKLRALDCNRHPDPDDAFAPPPPPPAKGAVVLHLVSRALGGGGSWCGVVENWIVLNQVERSEFLQPKGAGLNAEWKIDSTVLAKLLTHFYPSTENNDLSKNVFERQYLEAKVVAVDVVQSTALVKLKGSLKIKHTFYHRADSNVAEADVVGYAKVDITVGKLLEINLTTINATYAGGKFGVAVKLAK